MIRCGYELVITHGNGPQVGNLLIQHECAQNMVPAQPLDVLGAMTQGQIGYMSQQTLINYLQQENMNKPVISVITQVLVHKEDPDFQDPHKPVGPFYTFNEAEKLRKQKHYIIRKVKTVGKKVYRRVVPSPDPIKIVEGEAIRQLVDAGITVIVSGGGGIPVIEENGEIRGVEAVIDKDLAAAVLAAFVHADVLLMLTNINNVFLNYGTPDQTPIEKMALEEAKRYLEEGHFLSGSMAPKVLAGIRFLEGGGEKAIIAHLNKAVDAIDGKAGTIIYNNLDQRRT